MTNRFTIFDEVNKSNKGIELRGEVPQESVHAVVVRLSGYLDGNNSNDFMNAVLGIMDESPSYRTIIIDFLKVTYISSTGFGALCNILIQSKQSNKSLYLSNVGEKIADVMDVLGFKSFFEIIDSPENILA